MQFHDSLLQMIHDSTQYEQFSEPAMKRAQLENLLPLNWAARIKNQNVVWPPHPPTTTFV